MSKRVSSLYCGDTPRQVLEWRLNGYCEEIDQYRDEIKDLNAKIISLREKIDSAGNLRDAMAKALSIVVKETEK
jgi:uncharacterized coiled-coil DUF342 family protein